MFILALYFSSYSIMGMCVCVCVCVCIYIHMNFNTVFLVTSLMITFLIDTLVSKWLGWPTFYCMTPENGLRKTFATWKYKVPLKVLITVTETHLTTISLLVSFIELFTLYYLVYLYLICGLHFPARPEAPWESRPSLSLVHNCVPKIVKQCLT